MTYILWALMVPASIVITIIGLVLAPVLPFLASTDGWLPRWLWWFQTPDNPLDGDGGWINEHWQWRFKLPTSLCRYVGRVGWLWRNPAYGFGLVTLINPFAASFIGDDKVNDSPGHEGWCFIKASGLFQLVWVKRISSGYCLYFNFGWNIKGLIGSNPNKHLATYSFSPRLSKFKT